MKESIPWCEKYRPQHIEDIVLDPINRSIFSNILSTRCFHHLLFYGPPGVGKTTSADNLVYKYQTLYHKKNKETIIHLNASDERGIEVIRAQIYQFVRSKNLFEQGIKFVILDEVDYMTKNAQQALKNIIQSCLENVRFILICNYICRIDDSLKNEFTCIRFNQLPEQATAELLRKISVQEKVTLSDTALRTIQYMFHSDIRSMINYLQLNQNNLNLDRLVLFDDTWESLHILFENGQPKDIRDWLENTSSECSLDVKSLLNHYCNYVVQHHKERVNTAFLNIVETIIHSVNKDVLVEYFIQQVTRLYTQKIDNKDIPQLI